MSDHNHQTDPDQIRFSVPCIRIQQPIGDIYVASMGADLITQITYFDVRRIEKEKRDVETYLGIQRPLKKYRVDELQKYVNFIDATFPTSIILAIDDEYCSFDHETSSLVIKNYIGDDETPSARIRDIARVLDGQHRIEGLQAFKGVDDRNFEVPVSIFIGADLADQAYIFSIVNLEQSKVSKNLAYDLYALAKTRSPQRTCHNIAVALDRDPDSPFYKRIRRLGATTPGRSFEPISQSTFVESLMNYITNDPKGDRDKLIRRRNLPRYEGDNHHIFRPLFLEEEDISIAKNIDNYFKAVAERWPKGWETDAQGYILNRTNGFRALMRLMWHVYSYLCGSKGVMQTSEVLSLFEKVEANWKDFNTEEFPPGSSGESKLYNYLLGELSFLPTNVKKARKI